jgi:hypothetical protein
MSKNRTILCLVPALALAGRVALAQQPNVFDTIEKMKMRWDLAYKLKAGDLAKYQLDTITSTKASSFNVAEPGSEETSETSDTFRVYLTEKVVELDDQNVATLEFTYDNVVQKHTEGGKETVADTAAMVGRKFTVRVSAKGKIIDVEGSGDTEDFKKTVQSLFLVYPDKTLKIGDEWDDKKNDTVANEAEGLQVETSTGIKYTVKDFEEYQRHDSVVMNLVETIDQKLTARKDDPGGTITSMSGEGTGKGSSKGSLRVDAKSGQLLTYEFSSQTRSTMTVDEDQLVGGTIRTKYTTETSLTTNIRLL